MRRRHFIHTVVVAPFIGRPLQRVANASFDPEEATIASLQEAMRAGRVTARSLVERYLDRIASLDRTGPTLRSFLETNPDALKTAEALDAERRSRAVRGPLHGIPILLKDNINTTAPLTTTAGSLALEGSIPPREATIARRLRDAGAVVIGKANMSEWANFRSTSSTSGWSARGGQCRNPYVLDRSPLGSSSGSAVAAAANLCAVTVGTETDGSIVVPSSVCGVVGLKPTVGLAPTEGIVPIARSQDAPGPICRTVRDAATVLGVMAGRDFSSSLVATGLRGARIGVARKLFIPDAGVQRLMDLALDAIRAAGAVLVEVEMFERAPSDEIDVLLYEFKAEINAYLATLAPPFRSLTLKGLIEFNERNRARELSVFDQEMFRLAEAKGPLTERGYTRALENCRRIARAEGIDAAISRYTVDAFVAPTCGPAGRIDPGNGDRLLGRAAAFPAVAGYPHITVPAGLVGELPVGLSFFGGARSEGTLFRLAYAFEQTTKARRLPKFLATTG